MRALVVILLVAVLPRAARADADERRWSLGGILGASVLEAEGGRGTPLVFGGELRMGHGLTDLLEVAGSLAVTSAPSAEVPNAHFGAGQASYFVDRLSFEAALEARVTAGVDWHHALARVHPFLGVRAGLALVSLTDGVLLDPEHYVLERVEDSLSLAPVFHALLGVEARLSDGMAWGLRADATLDTTGALTGLFGTVELSFVRYCWWRCR